MTDAPTDASLPVKRKRGRPAGRTPLQEESLRQTRAAILGATASLLSSKTYVETTIDDIIRTAGIGRTTFYLHFESKFALAIAIVDSIATDWHELFLELAAIPARDIEKLIAWIATLSDLYIDHGYVSQLAVQLPVFEPKFEERLQKDRNDLIDLLGQAGVGGFAIAARTPAGEPLSRERAQAHLLLVRLDRLCHDFSRGLLWSAEDMAIQVRLVAEELSAFLSLPATRRA
ncbi:hypothetical protein NT2_01_05140 [Caenibius tardaugens NBRC 16725]|uniref:HTH tetR-type domain-containing protein n=1 Tax=Caenibius tardaugens NBRC 16725 TaxID=1219035 RepID=U2YHS7_9SPHN|nr:TetR/AcrR family transcriptional regulator [Caenibius tardaugens]AZI37034.1 TetR/AcrR family transcriptional regulator [Caenibius tardaugens NBRC 16725]GAD47740.1 hypothetical protein NT2_01_05140 [Caenibius tardaugens NBRC 16725]